MFSRCQEIDNFLIYIYFETPLHKLLILCHNISNIPKHLRKLFLWQFSFSNVNLLKSMKKSFDILFRRCLHSCVLLSCSLLSSLFIIFFRIIHQRKAWPHFWWLPWYSSPSLLPSVPKSTAPNKICKLGLIKIFPLNGLWKTVKCLKTSVSETLKGPWFYPTCNKMACHSSKDTNRRLQLLNRRLKLYWMQATTGEYQHLHSFPQFLQCCMKRHCITGKNSKCRELKFL